MKVTTPRFQAKEHVKDTDIEALERQLGDRYSGMWIAVLESGEIIADKHLAEIVNKGKDKIATLFKIPEKGVVMLR